MLDFSSTCPSDADGSNWPANSARNSNRHRICQSALLLIPLLHEEADVGRAGDVDWCRACRVLLHGSGRHSVRQRHALPCIHRRGVGAVLAGRRTDRRPAGAGLGARRQLQRTGGRTDGSPAAGGRRGYGGATSGAAAGAVHCRARLCGDKWGCPAIPGQRQRDCGGLWNRSGRVICVRSSHRHAADRHIKRWTGLKHLSMHRSQQTHLQ
jgi:hypothetical protein